MQIYNDTEAVLYKNGYFVIYTRSSPDTKGKLPKWAIAGTYANPPKQYLHLVPAWEESRRKASIKKEPDPIRSARMKANLIKMKEQ